jgi:hypothetical protein
MKTATGSTQVSHGSLPLLLLWEGFKLHLAALSDLSLLESIEWAAIVSDGNHHCLESGSRDAGRVQTHFQDCNPSLHIEAALLLDVWQRESSGAASLTMLALFSI